MNELERAIAIKKEHSAAIRSRPGVTGIGYGWRTRGGEATDEPAIRIYVERKLPPESLSQDAMLPAEIEGIPTDIVELGPIRLQAGTLPDEERHRPLRGGQRIGPRGSGAGTAGCFAKTDGNPERHVLITAQHVIYDARELTRFERDGAAVGQPTLCSWCSKCCTSSDEIGDVWFALNEPLIDAAVIELRPGTQWLPEVEHDTPLVIKGIEAFANIPDIKAAPDSARRVFRRGFITGLVPGMLEDLAFDGTTEASNGEMWNFQDLLQYSRVQANKPFSASGDSGGPVLTQSQKVAGIYYAASANTGLAIPIQRILDTFKLKCGVGLTVATANAPGQVQTAPAAKQALAATVHSAPLLDRAYEQIRATPRGRELDALVQQHHHEALHLVRSNKRVATVWHRNHGPEIVQLALKSLREQNAPLPSSFDGRTFDECARRIADIFRRYGSPALVREIDRHEPEVRRMGGITYRQFLDWLAPIG